jgi:hypothetical protein
VSELTSTNAFRRNLHQTCRKRCGAAIVLFVDSPMYGAVLLPCPDDFGYPMLWNVEVRLAPIR